MDMDIDVDRGPFAGLCRVRGGCSRDARLAEWSRGCFACSIEGSIFTKCLERLNLLVERSFTAARMNVEKILQFLVCLLVRTMARMEKELVCLFYGFCKRGGPAV